MCGRGRASGRRTRRGHACLCASETYHMMAEGGRRELHRPRPSVGRSRDDTKNRAGQAEAASSHLLSAGRTGRGREGEREQNGVTCQIQWRMRMRLSEWHLRRGEPLSIEDRCASGTTSYRFCLLSHPCRIALAISLYIALSHSPSLPLSVLPLRRRCLANERAPLGGGFPGKGQADRVMYLQVMANSMFEVRFFRSQTRSCTCEKM